MCRRSHPLVTQARRVDSAPGTVPWDLHQVRCGQIDHKEHIRPLHEAEPRPNRPDNVYA